MMQRNQFTVNLTGVDRITVDHPDWFDSVTRCGQVNSNYLGDYLLMWTGPKTGDHWW